jgi:malonyl-CoA decarboxylase
VQIMAEEKVHAIHSWDDLRRRLGSDRRVFAWTHPSLPGEPLVALHVALCQELPARMGDLIRSASADGGGGDASGSSAANAAADASASTAVFYSISNMQPGLAGVDLGNNLIKAAAKALAAELPELRTLCTLSPLPGFAAWLDAQMEARRGQSAGSLPKLLLPDEAAALASAAGEHRDLTAAEQAALLQSALRQGRWRRSPELARALRPALLRLAAHYLLREKRRGQARDPVANFHLRNGARVLRLCPDADVSEAGRARSHGVMVSYGYSVRSVEENNRRYLVGGEVAAAPEVLRLLEGG